MLPLPSGTNARAALVESHKRPELIVSGGLGWNARKDRATPTSDPPKLATETSTSHNVGHHRYWELPVRTCTSLDEEA